MIDAPWLVASYARIRKQAQSNLAPLLIHGSDLLALEALASQVVARALCETPHDDLPCGKCAGCQMRLAGHHPDLHWIFPQTMAAQRGLPVDLKSGSKPSKEIRVDEVRQMQAFFNTASSRAGERWAVIMPFEAVNLNAANALLKVLEEPPNGLRFLLVGQRVEFLLPTILSRVQRVTIPSPHFAQAVGWLRSQGVDQPDVMLSLALGDPFAAASLYKEQPEDLELRKKWLDWLASEQRPEQAPAGVEKLATAIWLDLMMLLCEDLLALQAGQPLRLFAWMQPKLVWSKRLRLDRMSDLFNYLLSEKRLAGKPLNPRLALESAGQRWHDSCQPK